MSSFERTSAPRSDPGMTEKLPPDAVQPNRKRTETGT